MSSKEKNTGKKVMSNKRKSKKSKVKFTKIRIIIFVIVVALVLGIGFGFKSNIENILNSKAEVNTSSDISTIDDNGLSIHFIDVGQGDSIAIRFPDDKTMLIDAGTSSSRNKLVTYLKNNFFSEGECVFDYVLLTHSDADHCGGMVTICQNFVINTIYRPYMYCVYPKTNATYDETEGDRTGKNVCTTQTYYNTISAFNSELDKNGNNAKIVWTDVNVCNSTNKIEGEGYYFDFYYPTNHYVAQSAGTIENDFSPIMVLNYNGKKIMFTGDASITAEENAMSNYSLPDVDLLKVGHHGSRTSTGADFLNQIKPEIAVISVGEGNTYNHPTDDCLNRLGAIGSEIFRTDLNGNIIANITSETTATLNMYVNVMTDTSSNQIYIHVEYLMAGIILLAVTLCFGIKIRI